MLTGWFSPLRVDVFQFCHWIFKIQWKGLIPSRAAFSSAVCLDNQWEQSRHVDRLCCHLNYLIQPCCHLNYLIQTLYLPLSDYFATATLYSQFFNNTFWKISACYIQSLFPTTSVWEETKLPFLECCLFRDKTENSLGGKVFFKISVLVV